jgi:hypothetical protein
MLFRHFKKKGDQARINTNSWMMSYADMATTLLASFVVLSTLGKDQTGISLYNGTGSFAESMQTFGLPGLTSNSSRIIPLETSSPHYRSASTEDQPPPDGQDSARLIDIEEEQFQQFLAELNRLFPVTQLPRITGQAVVDLYEPFNKKGPLLRPKHLEMLAQVVPALHRSNYRVEVVVWATMPSDKAWLRAVTQARQAADEIAAAAQLDPAMRARLIAVGKPWRYRDVPRPVISFSIIRTEPTP